MEEKDETTEKRDICFVFVIKNSVVGILIVLLYITIAIWLFQLIKGIVFIELLFLWYINGEFES
jgi:hypothetical protein